MPKSHDIVFANVAFSYVQSEPVLKGVSFTTEEERLTAIVEDSGSSKSTVLNLIAKYYDTQSGSISIGGQSIRDTEEVRMMEMISLVDRDMFLFSEKRRFIRRNSP